MSKTDDLDTTLQTIATTKFATAGMGARLGWLSWSPHAKADQPAIGSQMHSSPPKLHPPNSGRDHVAIVLQMMKTTIIVDVLH